jgi:hypothetical protein
VGKSSQTATSKGKGRANELLCLLRRSSHETMNELQKAKEGQTNYSLLRRSSQETMNEPQKAKEGRITLSA